MLQSETANLRTKIRPPHQRGTLTNQKLSQIALKDWTRWPPEVPSNLNYSKKLSLLACSFSSPTGCNLQ